MKLESLKPGMVVYDVHSERAGNTTLRSMGVWQVFIVAVDHERKTVEASWNHNAPRTYYRHQWSKWRLKEPILVNKGFGTYRLATRDERKAAEKP